MKIGSGLDGVVAAQTELSLVDGSQGVFIYRGYWVSELAKRWQFEDVAYLLWYGDLPDAKAQEAMRTLFARNRELPSYVTDIIRALPAGTDMMSVVRTAVSALNVGAWPPTVEDAVRMTAMMPTMIATRMHFEQSTRMPDINPSLSHVAHYLYLLTGEVPLDSTVSALNAYFVLTMDHGLNASTFAARVVTSTQSDLAAAIAAALGAMKGPLHGGAPSEVMDMLDQIGGPENAERWIRQQLECGERLMGFGHRVYKTRDPRAVALRHIVSAVAAQAQWFEFATHVEDVAIRLLAEYKPGRHLYTNVEYWAAAVFRAVMLPKNLYTPTFSASRVVGWTAHVLEQARHNRLIRPESEYVGRLPEVNGQA